MSIMLLYLQSESNAMYKLMVRRQVYVHELVLLIHLYRDNKRMWIREKEVMQNK